MDAPHHTLEELFAQLGLSHDGASVCAFIAQHRPLPDGMALHEAPMWNPSQAGFLRDALKSDADWAPVVDTLNAALHESPVAAEPTCAEAREAA